MCSLFKRFGNVRFQLFKVSWLVVELERLRLRIQPRRLIVAINWIQRGNFRHVSWRRHFKRNDETSQNGVELSIRQVISCTHAAASTIAVMESAGTLFFNIQPAVWDEFVWILKPGLVVIRRVNILKLVNYSSPPQSDQLTKMKVVPAGMVAPL